MGLSYLTADENVCDFLRGVMEPVEIRDGEGKLLGLFNPHIPPEVQAQYDKAKKLFDATEIKRRKAEEQGKGSSLAEVLQRIQSREVAE